MLKAPIAKNSQSQALAELSAREYWAMEALAQAPLLSSGTTCYSHASDYSKQWHSELWQSA
jgi:hypothetical protein